MEVVFVPHKLNPELPGTEFDPTTFTLTSLGIEIDTEDMAGEKNIHGWNVAKLKIKPLSVSKKDKQSQVVHSQEEFQAVYKEKDSAAYFPHRTVSLIRDGDKDGTLSFKIDVPPTGLKNIEKKDKKDKKKNTSLPNSQSDFWIDMSDNPESFGAISGLKFRVNSGHYLLRKMRGFQEALLNSKTKRISRSYVEKIKQFARSVQEMYKPIKVSDPRNTPDPGQFGDPIEFLLNRTAQAIFGAMGLKEDTEKMIEIAESHSQLVSAQEETMAEAPKNTAA